MMKLFRKIKWHFTNKKYSKRFVKYIIQNKIDLDGSVWYKWNFSIHLFLKCKSLEIGVVCLYKDSRFKPVKNTLYSNFVIDENMDTVA